MYKITEAEDIKNKTSAPAKYNIDILFCLSSFFTLLEYIQKWIGNRGKEMVFFCDCEGDSIFLVLYSIPSDLPAGRRQKA